MCNYLKNMEGYKLNDLKYKEFDSIQEMFDRSFKRVNTFKDFRTELVKGKEKRAGTELIQEITKKQKVEDDKETSELKQCLEIIPDEEEVTTDAIPSAVKSPSIGRIVGIKSLFDAVWITAAHVFVNAAQLRFSAAHGIQRKYAKCLLLLVHS
ncbi:hypothetical protein Tco_1140710 [Tanacetum coccineum]